MFSTDEVCPLSIRSLMWDAKAMGPLNNFISVSCLIDTGAHINCIRSDMVERLNLKPKLLAKPPPITLAFEGSSAEKPLVLSSFVAFSLYLKFRLVFTFMQSSHYSEFMCRFYPRLTLPSFNKIVVDCDTHTVTHKPTKINLLDKDSFNSKSLSENLCHLVNSAILQY